MTIKNFFGFLCSFFLLLVMAMPAVSARSAISQGKKVMVVMSYHQTYKGEIEIREGLEKALPGARFKYVWLDTKINKKGGPEKAKEAIELYQEFKPDGVIAADDSAQELFVVPYLKDKEPVPVVFCGVNFEAGKYGYPAGNVTGVLEKKHYREGISFAQLIDRNVEKIAVVHVGR